MLVTYYIPLGAYNLKQLSSKDGLSNSSIMEICQDSDRFMWFGSADGLNMYNGVNLEIYKPSADNLNNLAGSMIDGIMEAEPGILWVATNYGFNRLNKHTQKVECYGQFEGRYHFSKTSDNRVFVIHEDNKIEYYDREKKKFIVLPYKGIINNDIMDFFIDRDNVLWILQYNGKITNAQIVFDKEFPKFKILNDFKHDFKITNCYFKKGRVLFIDSGQNLFELETDTRKKHFIKNLSREIIERGIISDLIPDGDDYLLGFLTNGLIRLKHIPEKETKYEVESINIHCGVFALYKDEKQDIIWIGTDGQGVYMYSHDSYSMRATTFYDIPVKIQKNIRAIFLDHLNNLWIGTRDDGIFRIADYAMDKKISANEVTVFTTNNCALINNSNYVIYPNRENSVLWIAGDGPGLNYYSYNENKIKAVTSDSPIPILHIHAICETSDTTLWLASGGQGIMKATISWRNKIPHIKHLKSIQFTKKEKMSNHFFSICQENDSILWFGNRRHGAIRMNLGTEKFSFIRFDEKEAATINDILYIHRDQKGKMWFGSTYGITRLDSSSKQYIKSKNYNESHGLPNNTIHSILEDKKGNLWLSTNSGIVEFNTTNEHFRVYDYQNGIDVVEFCDGASYLDPKNGFMFFGGRNGFVSIKQDNFTKSNFNPAIFFTGIKIYEKEFNISQLSKKDNKGDYIELEYNQNFFSISFVALDYLNSGNNNYLYNLENFNDKWIDNRQSNSVTFTNISPGEYTLRIKCENGNKEASDIYSIRIKILPPWYQTTWAYFSYILLFITASYFTVNLLIKRYKEKKMLMMEKMNQQQKDDIYESKLRFFTNITHEFCTPLTLIYGPCERIISYNGSDEYIKKYAGLILKNTEQLNALIQELIEFRRIETGHKTRDVEPTNISALAKNITESFYELAESKNINFSVKIDTEILWNTDKSCFNKILINLISNAFKYTPENGSIDLEIQNNTSENTLILEVSNTGKGIKEEEISLVFDRYKILENFEKQNDKGLASRNGLGLAICHNLVKLLDGNIEVISVVDKITSFKVKLPQLHADNKKRIVELKESIHLDTGDKKVLENRSNEISNDLKLKTSILVIDDDPEILWFISEIFTEEYNVITTENPKHVFEILEQTQPSLIISDVMMPGIDGLSLSRELKNNKRTSHIPIVIISAKNTPEDQVEGIESGAEAYITKPFNVSYIKSIIERIILRQNELKEYYSSAISAFEIKNGQFVHKGDKQFFDKMLEIIENNISDASFSTEKLAIELGVSSRQLYRRLSLVSNQTPGELIKEYRLIVVEKLLVSTKLSIDEIMYKSGYSNRGNFSKIFSQKYGMTPKVYRDKKNNGLLN